MTDAQQIIDCARRNLNSLADDVERHFTQVADKLRDNFSHHLPSRRVPPAPPPTTYQRLGRWFYAHERTIGIAVGFTVLLLGGGSYYLITRTGGLFGVPGRRRRRVLKSSSGARTNVVVVAGAVANPLTSAVYLDLERKGFAVYVVCHTPQDEHYVRAQSWADLHPLSLDLVDPFTAQHQLERFSSLFEREHYALEGSEPHRLTLRALVLVPDTSSPARIEEISSEEWSDALNAKVLNPIAITQLLLPALKTQKAKILLLTPSVAPALASPAHAVESTVSAAMGAFAATLSAELAQTSAGVQLSHFKLGAIDIPAETTKQRRDGAPKVRATPIKRLHEAVFDTIVAARPRRTVYIGRGSWAYDAIGRFGVGGLVGWMVGVGGGKRKEDVVAKAQEEAEALARTQEEAYTSSVASHTWVKVEQED